MTTVGVNMNKVIIFDIDGTIADCTHRLYLIQGENKDWDMFHAKCISDRRINSMIEMLNALEPRNEIVYCTTRPDSSEKLTRSWLKRNVSGYCENDKILMRKSIDHRPDHIVKPLNLLKAGLPPDKVLFIVEDRSSVVKALRDAGYKVIQCDEGNY